MAFTTTENIIRILSLYIYFCFHLSVHPSVHRSIFGDSNESIKNKISMGQMTKKPFVVTSISLDHIYIQSYTCTTLCIYIYMYVPEKPVEFTPFFLATFCEVGEASPRQEDGATVLPSSLPAALEALEVGFRPCHSWMVLMGKSYYKWWFPQMGVPQ